MPLYRVRLRGFLVGQAHENVMHFQSDDGVATNPMDLANEIATQWCVFLKDGFPTGSFSWDLVHVNDLTNPATAPADNTIAIPGTGASNSSIIPFTTFKLKLKTNFAGRKARGRLFMSTPNAGNITAGFLTTATLTFWNGKAAQLMARYGPGGASNYNLVIHGKNDPANQSFPVTAIVMDTRPATCVKRQIGRGM